MRLIIPMQYVDMPGEPRLVLDLTLQSWLDEGRQVFAYRLTVDDKELFTGTDLRSGVGTVKLVREVAATLLSFWAAYGESLHHSGKQSEYWDEHTEAQRAFLVANFERLSVVAEEWS